jgi:hypothetical protein
MQQLGVMDSTPRGNEGDGELKSQNAVASSEMCQIFSHQLPYPLCGCSPTRSYLIIFLAGSILRNNHPANGLQQFVRSERFG